MYDKIDFQVNNINNANSILTNYPVGIKCLDLCSNTLYVNNSDQFGNNFISYKIPDRTKILVPPQTQPFSSTP